MQIEEGLRTRLRITGIVLLLLMLIAYGLFQARHLIIGPVITLNSPQNGEVLTDEKIVINGRAQNISRITLNDRPIFIDEEGLFHEELLLPESYTIMTIQAEDRFGRKTHEQIYLVHK